MARRLNTFVYVPDKEGVPVGFGPADDVPDWAAALITNPDVWASDEPRSTVEVGSGPVTSSDPVERLAAMGATHEELDVVRSILAELTDEERAEVARFAADPSDDELLDHLAEWRRIAEENGGDLRTAFEQVGEAALGDPAVTPSPPTRSGAGSGRDAWVEYARANDFDIAEDARREDIIEALAEAGIPIE